MLDSWKTNNIQSAIKLPLTQWLTGQPPESVDEKPKTKHSKNGSSNFSKLGSLFFKLKIAKKTKSEYKKYLGFGPIIKKLSIETKNKREKIIKTLKSTYLIFLCIKKNGKQDINEEIINEVLFIPREEAHKEENLVILNNSVHNSSKPKL